MQTSQPQMQPQAQAAPAPIQPPPANQPTNGQAPAPGAVQYSQPQQQQPFQQPQQPQGQQQYQQQPQPQRQLSQGQNFAAQQQGPAQQPTQQHQQHYPHQGLNGGWQSDKDYQDRRKMIAKIVHLLQQRKPNAPQEWLKKLPQMAKRLEESLYRSAKSFEEYNDANTLKHRLQQLAVNIGMKTKKMQQQQAILQQQQMQQVQQQPQVQQPANPTQFARPTVQQSQPLVQPQAQQARAPAPVKQPVTQQQQPQQQPTGGQRIVNMAEINPIIGGQSQPQPAPAPAAPQQATVPVQQVQYTQPAPAAPVPAPAAPAPSGTSSQPAPAPSNGTRQVSDRQQVLRHQQQRLLLLRHAAKCQHEDGRCPVTPHCAGMKRLWKHIAECKNQKCLVPHCVSSRYVLSHYHRCKDVRCPVCGPVREAIHRSHEKQKQMQALKQRHQQAIQQTQMQGGQPATTPGATTAAGALPQPVQQGSAVEPPNKRRKTGVFQPPGFQVPQRPLQQPSSSRAAIPTQPSTVRPGYTYSQAKPTPQVAAVPGLAFANGQVVMPKHSGPKPQEDHTLINCFSIEQIETHIASLNKGLQLPPQKLKAKCLEVLKTLQSHQHGWVFNTPVDPVELGLPDYFEVVKKPMDLGTIRKRLENNVYQSLEEFESHVNLTFDNAMLYNPEGSVVYNMANEMKMKFQHDYKKLIAQLNAEEDIKRRNGEACCLCGCEKLLFEPPVFYCNGMNCPSKRIRRNSYYYVAGNNQYHWCHQCFQELRDNSTIDLGDIQVKKEGLVKKKNDEVHEESWVQCDRCERWVHQICSLFNTRQNKDQRSEFACPKCTIEERKKKGQSEGTSSTPMAEDLPRTKLSEYLENHVRQKVDEFIEAKSQAKVQAEGCKIEDARKKLQMGGAITIRQVTSMDRKLEVRERMKSRYAFKNYPEEFTFRCKCIVVFQNLDGVDVMLFGLYVYEHDEKNPLPNKRTVYISYLDSVHYMRPRQMRTFIYHEILISYLDYVRRRGFSTAHIWACPPLKGDDYILYAKPEDQKTPKDDRLRQWYMDMLHEAQRRGIVGKLTNMHDLYFSNERNDATVVPYMDGDYFPAEVENIIKDIEEGKSGKKGSSQGKKKDKKAKQKKKSGRGGTRSSGLDEEALKASGFYPAGKDSKSLEEGARDYVMVKLGETIQPMKESFIVAYLGWQEAREEDMEVPKEIQEYREKHGITWKIESEKEKPKAEISDPKKDDDRKDGAEDGPESKDESNSESPAGDEQKTGSPAGPESMEVESTGENAATGAQSNSNPKDTPAEDANAKISAENASEEKDPNDSASTSGETKGPAHLAVTDCEAKIENDPVSKNEVKDVGNTEAGTEQGKEASEPPEKNDEATPMEGVITERQTEGEGQNKEAEMNYEGEEKKSTDEAPASNSSGTEKKPEDASSSTAAKNAVNLSIREGKFAAMAARKRNREGSPVEAEKENKEKEEDKPEETALTVKDSKGRLVKVLDDDAEELDCEFLNNRQAFLNLCQGNHYQFDHLRRAKHSSMMVLWHLHNRDAPKFVQQCATCSREILTGFRFHCPTCADFDQCQDCVRNSRVPNHPHPLKPMPVAGSQQSDLTEAQRKERQRSIQLHMTLLLHAATCNSSKCPSANCTKMKGLLKHGSQCQVKATGGCNVCKRIWALLQIHARQCKAKTCPVPNCMAIRERVRQLKKQQQAMDDRRRQEMNRAYRGKR